MNNLRTLIITIMMAMPFAGHAQLGNLLGNVAKSVASQSGAGDVVANILGTLNISTGDIKGNWTYKQPALVLESENLLTTAVGSMATAPVEKKMQTYLDKVGFSAGKVSLQFNEDGTFAATIGGKTVRGHYAIEGAYITLSSPLQTLKTKCNVKVTGNELQLSVPADKLLTLMQTLCNVSNTTTLKTASSLLKNYKGVQLGLKFARH